MSGLFFRNLLERDEPAQVGNDQETKALSEMNELQELRIREMPDGPVR
jgi:hypothetical protein